MKGGGGGRGRHPVGKSFKLCSQTGTKLKKISSLGNVNSYPYRHIGIKNLVLSSVADPHHCEDPNPAFTLTRDRQIT
jgi:hypothetical protein